MRGTPISKHEKLNIFSRRSRKGKNLSSQFIDEFERGEGTK
jgi:hypothetical protein